MNLYAWQPKGHGEYSFFVVAASEAEAREAVEARIKRGREAYETDGYENEQSITPDQTAGTVTLLMDLGGPNATADIAYPIPAPGPAQRKRRAQWKQRFPTWGKR